MQDITHVLRQRSSNLLRYDQYIQLAILHGFLGILVGVIPTLSYYWSILILILGIYKTYTTNDKFHSAAKFAFYYVTLEALLRITKGYLTWEFAKYGVVILLGLGIIVSRRRLNSKIFVILLLLLIPSLLVVDFPNLTEARKSILFNLSGPFSLVFAGLYFYKLKISTKELFEMLGFSMLPILSLVTYLILFTPDLETIEFGSEAVFETSGGFGPNQLSTILGYGMSVLLIGLLVNRPFFKYRWIDLIILLLIAFRSLITFSRGGTLSILLVLATFILIVFFKGKSSKLQNTVLALMIASIGAFFIWNYANQISNEALQYRYSGVNMRTGEEEEFTSGRLMILLEEINLFQENPVLGVGPGMGKVYREREYGAPLAAHSEFSRLLGEHGIFGLLAALLILGLPIKKFLSVSNAQYLSITLIWSVLAIYTMFHSAMRLALPGFIYGLGLITLYVPKKKNSVYRKQAL